MQGKALYFYLGLKNKPWFGPAGSVSQLSLTF
jgi:hypothetical protein